MGTRSFVGMMEQNKIRSIYVHFDGYLDGVGAELQSEYTDSEKIKQLLDMGDSSSLGSGQYRNDGETDVDAVVYNSFDHFYDACDRAWAEWYYVYDNGIWYCGNTYNESKLYRKLTPYDQAVKIYEEESQRDYSEES